MKNISTGAAAFVSYANPLPTRMTPWFAMSGATGVPAAGLVAVADQRPRTAKLGRPPRGTPC